MVAKAVTPSSVSCLHSEQEGKSDLGKDYRSLVTNKPPNLVSENNPHSISQLGGSSDLGLLN